MAKAKDFFSLIKFSHTVFALPFAIIGFLLGIKDSTHSTNEIFILLLKVLVCMITARTSAMAFNRYIDRQFDALNPRTAVREIPAQIISPKQALLLVILSSAIFIITTFFINNLCFYLSPVALFITLGYSYTKRFTALCHLILGIGLALAPVGAYLAVTNHFDIVPVLFGVLVIFWVSGFDMLYALQDEDFDKANNLFSIPVFIGRKNTLWLSFLFHLVSIACVVSCGLLAHFGLFYWVGVLCFSSLLMYQHVILKPTDISRINLAFATLNGISSIIFASLFIIDFFLKTHF
jgi:4-hydroxybenzoate polyprenyltransferase